MVPIGCLVMIGGVGAVIFGVLAMIRSSGPAEESFDRVRRVVRVIAAVGTPMKRGLLTTGNIEYKNDTGNANLQYDIAGPKGKARVEVVATRVRKVWQYEVLRVTPKDGQPIDLVWAMK